jgi:hypothetical protein
MEDLWRLFYGLGRSGGSARVALTTNPNIRQAVAIASTHRGRRLIGVRKRPVESLVVAGLYSGGIKYV